MYSAHQLGKTMKNLALLLALSFSLSACGTVDDYGTSQEDVNEDLQEQIDDINSGQDTPDEQTSDVDQQDPVTSPEQPSPEPEPDESTPVVVVVAPQPDPEPTNNEEPAPVSEPEPDEENAAREFPYFETWTHLNNRLGEDQGSEVGCYNNKLSFSSWTSHGFSFVFPSEAYTESYYSARVNDWIQHVGDSNWRYKQLIVVECTVDIPNYKDPVIRRDNSERIDGAESALYYIEHLDAWILYVHDDLSIDEQQYAYSWTQWIMHKQITSEYIWNQSYAYQLWCETWGE